jgi:hypothetical protein
MQNDYKQTLSGAPGYRIISAAKAYHLYKIHSQTSAKHFALKRKLERAALADLRTQFFEEYHFKEIDRQLANIELESAPLVTTRPTFALPERSRISDAMLGHTAFNRGAVIEDMARLCVVGVKLPSWNYSDQGASSTLDGDLCCSFCMGSAEPSYRPFANKNSLKIHVHKKHLPKVDFTLKLECPYPLCSDVLDNIEHLKNHFALCHGVFL